MATLRERFKKAAPLLDYYTNAESAKSSATVTLVDLIDGIRSDSFLETVTKVRDLLADGDKKGADAVKKMLPAISVSGTVTTGGRAKAVAEERFAHSGLLQIDLDGKDNPEWTVAAMVEFLKADPHIQAGFVTPSGVGVKGLARIPADAGNHKAAFLVAEKYYADKGLVIDPSCKDAVRLCFVSHDPDAWLRNEAATEFKVELTVVEEPEELPKAAKAGRVIREVARELGVAEVRSMLAKIPPRPVYGEWLRVASAVWDALGEEEGTAALNEWSPEETAGEYAGKYSQRLTDIKAGSLVWLAQENGWQRPAPVSAAKGVTTGVAQATSATVDGSEVDGEVIPLDVLPVPGGDIGHDLSSRHIFAVIGKSKRLFVRSGIVMEVAREGGNRFALAPITAERFASVVETFGARVMKREKRDDSTMRWRSCCFPVVAAKIALSSDGAREELPMVRQLVSAPVIVSDGKGGSEVISGGWHPHGGGTFVTYNGDPIEVMPLADALAVFNDLMDEFLFASDGDFSRAVASFISPALKFGSWMVGVDFPMDLAEADQSQSGKTYRQKLVCAVYGEKQSAIVQSKGGVGSLDEHVSTAMLAGRPFIAFDNFRGKLDSGIVETAIRGVGSVLARSLRTVASVDCSPFLWQLSTNGAELTKDLSNRSIVTRIRKQEGKDWRKYPEGDLEHHIIANQPKYLAAVHAIVREWAAQGCPQTNESRHDFKGWVRTLDWIVQNIFGLAPLLDDHEESQQRTSNPKMQWLRDISHAIIHSQDYVATIPWFASDIADLAEEIELTIPGRKEYTREDPSKTVGRVLGQLFRESDGKPISIDGLRISRVMTAIKNDINRGMEEKKTYLIESVA